MLGSFQQMCPKCNARLLKEFHLDQGKIVYKFVCGHTIIQDSEKVNIEASCRNWRRNEENCNAT